MLSLTENSQRFTHQVQVAVMNHRWYLDTFKDYPKHRCAIIPFLLWRNYLTDNREHHWLCKFQRSTTCSRSTTKLNTESRRGSYFCPGNLPLKVLYTHDIGINCYVVSSLLHWVAVLIFLYYDLMHRTDERLFQICRQGFTFLCIRLLICFFLWMVSFKVICISFFHAVHIVLLISLT